MQQHPLLGAEIVSRLGSDYEWLQRAIRQEHERIDGPDKLVLFDHDGRVADAGPDNHGQDDRQDEHWNPPRESGCPFWLVIEESASSGGSDRAHCDQAGQGGDCPHIVTFRVGLPH